MILLQHSWTYIWRNVSQHVTEILRALAKKYCLLTWAHELTKQEKSLASLPPFLCLSLLCHLPCNHIGIQELMDIITRKDGDCPQGGKQQSLLKTHHPPGNSDLLILTSTPMFMVMHGWHKQEFQVLRVLEPALRMKAQADSNSWGRNYL
jgi:hypothetical protein